MILILVPNLPKCLPIQLKKHAPLTFRTIRDNQVSLMIQKFSKAVVNKSRLRNTFLKWPSRENFLAYKNVKNKCNYLSEKANKYSFQEATKNGIMSNKYFWNTANRF